MTIFRIFPALPLLLILSACGEPAQQTETAEEYAARINGTAPAATVSGQPASGQQVAATVAAPLPGAAPGPMTQGTQTDPAASSCGAPAAAEFLGQADTPRTRQAISEKSQARAGIRFIRPGEAQTQDFNNNRLNVMLDASGIIRDLRCG